MPSQLPLTDLPELGLLVGPPLLAAFASATNVYTESGTADLPSSSLNFSSRNNVLIVVG